MEIQNNSKENSYSGTEWFCIKITLIPLVIVIAFYSIWQLQFDSILQENICSYVNCTYIVKAPVNYLLTAAILLSAILYVFEKLMIFSLSMLTVLSFIIFSYTESVGISGEYGLFTVIFAVQLIAYVYHHFNPGSNLPYNRIQFSLQLLAAAYTLSALAKLSAGGMGWFSHYATNFAAQTFREYNSAYVSTGHAGYYAKGVAYSTFLLQHAWITKTLLALTVVIEGGALVLITGKRNAFIYGILLTAFHIGIFITMNIVLFTLVVSVTAFTVNPLHLGYLLLKNSYGKIKR